MAKMAIDLRQKKSGLCVVWIFGLPICIYLYHRDFLRFIETPLPPPPPPPHRVIMGLPRGNLCTARALRATFRLCSPRRAPKQTPWERP